MQNTKCKTQNAKCKMQLKCNPTAKCLLHQKRVPLYGLVEVLACGLLLADIDVLGASLTNTGVVWHYSGETGEVCLCGRLFVLFRVADLHFAFCMFAFAFCICSLHFALCILHFAFALCICSCTLHLHFAVCILYFAFCILYFAFAFAFCILHFAYCIVHFAFCNLHVHKSTTTTTTTTNA